MSRPKYDQLLRHNYNVDFNYTTISPLNSINKDNYWLAGFTHADGCFHISVVKSNTHITGFCKIRVFFEAKWFCTIKVVTQPC